MTATTIDEVITDLDRLIANASLDQSPQGYFAALHKLATLRIKQGIARQEFDNNERMERFHAQLAGRYLRACEQWTRGEKPTVAWSIAFEAEALRTPITLQHLLLGLNAHVNLDLAIAAVKTTGRTRLAAFKSDFDRVLDMLASLSYQVRGELVRIWPPFRLAEELPFVDKLLGFQFETARHGAWQFAEALATTPVEDWEDVIRQRDYRVARFGYRLYNPGLLLRAVFLSVRLAEPRPAQIIRTLDCLEADTVRVILRPALA